MNQWELKIKSGTLRKARENASNQVEIGFSFAFDWLRWWREFLDKLREKLRRLMQSNLRSAENRVKYSVIVLNRYRCSTPLTLSL